MHESDARFPRDRWADLKNPFRQISGSICAPRGFKCAAVFCDIKKLGTGKGSEKDKSAVLGLMVPMVRPPVGGWLRPIQFSPPPAKTGGQGPQKSFGEQIVSNRETGTRS